MIRSKAAKGTRPVAEGQDDAVMLAHLFDPDLRCISGRAAEQWVHTGRIPAGADDRHGSGPGGPVAGKVPAGGFPIRRRQNESTA